MGDRAWSWRTNPWKPVVELLWVDEDYKLVKGYLDKYPNDTEAAELLGVITREMECLQEEVGACLMNHGKLLQLKKDQARDREMAARLIAGDRGQIIRAMKDVVAAMLLEPMDMGAIASAIRSMKDQDLTIVGLLATHAMNNFMQDLVEEDAKTRN